MQYNAIIRRRIFLHDSSDRDFARQFSMSESSLQCIEMGEQSIGLDMLEQLCAQLHCEIGDLFPPDTMQQS
ncbi:MAG: helix-turn-helix domain-containing protein [bacterium]|nr:helix-turn-helix domain-containing protein [bacterium]